MPATIDRCSRRTLVLTSVFAVLFFSFAGSDADAREEKVERHVDALAATLSSDEREALARIPALDRRLLALRAYLRAGNNLRTRWSWSSEQIRDFGQSAEYEQLRADIAAITHEFERRNPGYTLYANTEVRSIDTQIERWNANPRVGTTASDLFRATQAALATSSTQPSRQSLAEFARLLKEWRPSPTAPLAAPGMSMHGQSRAIDFQIMKGGRIVAATEVNAVARQWEATGWSRKLKDAVRAASPRFKGPLAAPNEPWHYEYSGQKAGQKAE